MRKWILLLMMPVLLMMLGGYNLIRDIGKNTSCCNKEAMVLNAFRAMVEMKKHPDTYVKRLTEGRGMDQLF